MAHTRPRILHLVSARGGGMSRFARDLLAPGDALLHAAEGTWVSEQALDAPPARFTPYRCPTAPTAAADWLDALLDALGCDALHLHYLGAVTLPLLEAWAPRARPWLASLHDVGFLSASAFDDATVLPAPERVWAARCARVLARASAITAPSVFLAEAFAQACPGLTAEVLAPGVGHGRRPSRVWTEPLPVAAATAEQQSVGHDAKGLRSLAILGALGGHKGKQRLLGWLAGPAACGYRWTLIGYTEDQLQPGWIADGRLWVHGPFQPQDCAHWLRHYAADLVLFPNRLAESFSYALSDAWAAGVPVLVPDCGALGERVRAHGGGGVLEHPDDAAALMRQLRGLADGAQLARWRAQIATESRRMVPEVRTMRERMAAHYRRLATGAQPRERALERLQPWLRTQLDDLAFRHENIRLARDYAQLRAWAEKLEGDVAGLGLEADTQARARSGLEAALAAREEAIAALRARNAVVEADASALRARNAVVEADAATLASAVGRVQAELLSLQAQAAELSAQGAVLNAQLEATGQRLQDREGRILELNGALQSMHQRINALEGELRPLRTKGARYDRALGWIPEPLRRLARALLRTRRACAASGALR